MKHWHLPALVLLAASMALPEALAQERPEVCDTPLGIAPGVSTICALTDPAELSPRGPKLRGLEGVLLGAILSSAGEVTDAPQPLPMARELEIETPDESDDPCAADPQSFDCKYQHTLARLDARFGE